MIETPTLLDLQEFRSNLVGQYIRDFFDYWDRLRGSRSMPMRSEVDPLDVPRPILPSLYILIRDDDGGFRFRLVGTRLAEIFGRDITGKRIEEVLRDEVLSNALRSYDMIIRMKKPSHSRARYFPASGENPFLYQRLTLPLGTDAQTTHLLGALFLQREDLPFVTYSDVEAREVVTTSDRVETMLA